MVASARQHLFVVFALLHTVRLLGERGLGTFATFIPNRVGGPLVELVVIHECLGITWRVLRGLACFVEVGVANSGEAVVRIQFSGGAGAGGPIAGVKRRHLRQVTFFLLVENFSLQRSRFLNLHFLDHVSAVAAASTIVVRDEVVLLVVGELQRRVKQLALELGPLCVNQQLFAVLVRFELRVGFALVVGRILGEGHFDARDGCKLHVLPASDLHLVGEITRNGCAANLRERLRDRLCEPCRCCLASLSVQFLF